MALMVLTCMAIQTAAQHTDDATGEFQGLEIRMLDPTQEFAARQISAIHQDEEGFVWIGTNLGLYRYDGYRAKRYKNDNDTPHLLTSNKVTCLAGSGDTLWIGTNEGVNMLERRSGHITHHHFKDRPNSDYVNRILVTKDGKVILGTDAGLYSYKAQRDTFILVNDHMGGGIPMPKSAVHSIMQDSHGNVWVSVWDDGLYRWDRRTRKGTKIHEFDGIALTSDIYEDSRHRIWLSTWGKGLQRIDNPFDKQGQLRVKTYTKANTNGGLVTDVVNMVREDPLTGTLYVGTSNGISLGIVDGNGNVAFKALPKDRLPAKGLFNRGAKPMMCDAEGNVWTSISPLGGAVMSMRPRYLTYHALPSGMAEDDDITCMAYDSKGDLWLGLDRNGIIHHEAATGRTLTSKDIPALRGVDIPERVRSLCLTSDGRTILGTGWKGLLEISADGKRLTKRTKENTPWLADDFIYALREMPDGHVLVGTWKGVSLWMGGDKGMRLTNDSLKVLTEAKVRHFMRDKDGDIWMATRQKGIIRLTGDVHKPKTLRAKTYRQLKGSGLQVTEVGRVLQDREGRVWACSDDAGLLLYDAEQDAFESVNLLYGLPTEGMSSMEEAEDGTLWLATATNVINLSLKEDGSLEKMRYFPNDGMPTETYFTGSVSAAGGDGMVSFGCVDGYATVMEQPTMALPHQARVAITEIRIFGVPLNRMPEKEREQISEMTSHYTRSIRLTQAQNDFTIFFSHFDYDTPENTRFSYRLEGYDKDWVTARAGESSAHYCNLEPGRYSFRVRVATAEGKWLELDEPLKVRILPPLWLRWWAILIYIVLAGAVGFVIVMYLKGREEHRQELVLARLENEKMEELNHNKLQFFTNITHDLMTPLTVISASMNLLEAGAPNPKATFGVMRDNLNRLMRMLQQILEFRKAETGNLRLRVAKGDVADFCRREAESIRPLMNRRRLSLSLLCMPESIEGYFDSDALDKIMYNLLSNAVKYTPPMGHVNMTLKQTVDAQRQDVAELTVVDDGIGIAADKMDGIFKPFYDGQHRRLNTYGTGIGLSLTKDMVTLHHGTIEVKSVEGEGTTFVLTLPLRREAYAPEEIDEEEPTPQPMETPQHAPTPAAVQPEPEPEPEPEPGTAPREAPAPLARKATLLLVEDDGDLLAFVRNILQTTYNILTATNGREALDIMHTQHVDLVVTDMMMPIMDGMELVKELKADPAYSDCPIIMLTGKQDEDSQARIYEAGVDAYVSKPFHLSLLQARIHNLLQRQERTEQEVKQRLESIFGQLDVTDADEEFLKKCVAVVTRHLDKPDFGQQELADGVDTSKSTLYKRLKRLTGLNTPSFIRSIRMRAACDILTSTPRIRIADLAYTVGYTDPKYFSISFKKAVGVLPTEYALTASRQKK